MFGPEQIYISLYLCLAIFQLGIVQKKSFIYFLFKSIQQMFQECTSRWTKEKTNIHSCILYCSKTRIQLVIYIIPAKRSTFNSDFPTKVMLTCLL